MDDRVAVFEGFGYAADEPLGALGGVVDGYEAVGAGGGRHGGEFGVGVGFWRRREMGERCW